MLHGGAPSGHSLSCPSRPVQKGKPNALASGWNLLSEIGTFRAQTNDIALQYAP